MIVKGTPDYKRAQNLANDISRWANADMMFGENGWDTARIHLEDVCDAVIDHVDGFAKDVATTVQGTIRFWCEGRHVARCSSKQAWILACAIVENNIDF